MHTTQVVPLSAKPTPTSMAVAGDSRRDEDRRQGRSNLLDQREQQNPLHPPHDHRDHCDHDRPSASRRYHSLAQHRLRQPPPLPQQGRHSDESEVEAFSFAVTPPHPAPTATSDAEAGSSRLSLLSLSPRHRTDFFSAFRRKPTSQPRSVERRKPVSRAGKAPDASWSEDYVNPYKAPSSAGAAIPASSSATTTSASPALSSVAPSETALSSFASSTLSLAQAPFFFPRRSGQGFEDSSQSCRDDAPSSTTARRALSLSAHDRPPGLAASSDLRRRRTRQRSASSASQKLNNPGLTADIIDDAGRRGLGLTSVSSSSTSRDPKSSSSKGGRSLTKHSRSDVETDSPDPGGAAGLGLLFSTRLDGLDGDSPDPGAATVCRRRPEASFAPGPDPSKSRVEPAADPTAMRSTSDWPSTANEQPRSRLDGADRGAMVRPAEDIVYPEHVYRTASRTSYLPTSDAFEARRAVSPNYIEGPATSLPAPESIWRPAGQEAFWQRPHIGIGLPTAYHHERPSPRFVEPTEELVLPRVMTSMPRASDDLPMARTPRSRLKDATAYRTQPYQHAGSIATGAGGGQASYSSRSDSDHTEARQHQPQLHQHPYQHPQLQHKPFHQQSSVTSLHTSASTDGQRTSSSGPMQTADTSVTSFFQSRGGNDPGSEGHHHTRRDRKTNDEAGPSSSATGLDGGHTHGASRPPLLSPIASFSLGETSSESRSTPRITASQTLKASQLLEQMRLDELRAHSVAHSGYLEPNNGCEAVFLPKPRLRSQSVDNVKREYQTSGSVPRDRRRHRSKPSAAVSALEQEETLADDVAAAPVPAAASHEALVRSSAGLHRTSGSTSGTEFSIVVPERVSSKQTRHARAGSGQDYNSDSDGSSVSPVRPFSHYRIPPVPPRAPTSLRDGRQRSFTMSSIPDPSALHQYQAFSAAEHNPPTPALTDPATDDDRDDLDPEDYEAPDLPTVLRQGTLLDRERAAWRRQHDRSIGTQAAGLLLKRARNGHNRDKSGASRRTHGAISGHAHSSSIRRSLDMPPPPQDWRHEGSAEAGHQRTIWTDRRTGRSFLVADGAKRSEAEHRVRFSRSTPDLQASRGERSASRLSIDPSAGLTFCQHVAWCRAPGMPKKSRNLMPPRHPHDRNHDEKPASPRQGFFRPLLRAKSFNDRTPQDTARPARDATTLRLPASAGGRIPGQADAMAQAQQTTRRGGLLDRSIVSDEPVVIGKYTFPAPPDRSGDVVRRAAAGDPAEEWLSVPPRPSGLQPGDETADTSGGSGSQVGLALSTPSDTTSLFGSQSDVEALVSSIWAREEGAPRRLSSGRYPTKGYHRPTNSGEIRAQLNSSRSDAPSQTQTDPNPGSGPSAEVGPSASAGANEATGRKLPPPPLPLPLEKPLPTLPLSISSGSRLYDPTRRPREAPLTVGAFDGSSHGSNAAFLRAGSVSSYSDRGSLPVPPRKSRTSTLFSRRDTEGEGAGQRGSTSAGAGGSEAEHEAGSNGPFGTPMVEANSGAPFLFPFSLDEAPTSSRAAGRAPKGWSMDSVRTHDGAVDADYPARPPRSRTTSGADGESAWRSGSGEASRSFGSDEGNEGRMSKASSFDVVREVWDANEASIENLFFRPPAAPSTDPS
ncbi:hypothetical protein ACQY0O_000708 [Thecaphora frezii]